MNSRNISPKEQFARFIKGYVIVFILAVASCVFSIWYSAPHGEKHPVEVTLINAYSSMQKCGSKGHYTCEVFTGRFRTADGTIYVREMDGFFYHRYVDEGRKDIEGASITLSDYDRGYELPSVVFWMGIIGGLLGFVQFFGFIFMPLMEYDVNDAQREWEREREEEERRERYGY